MESGKSLFAVVYLILSTPKIFSVLVSVVIITNYLLSIYRKEVVPYHNGKWGNFLKAAIKHLFKPVLSKFK
jgi:hypothetical protein